MQSTSLIWTDGGWTGAAELPVGVQLIMVFGAGAKLREPGPLAGLRALAPTATVVGCSTAGEIAGNTVGDDGVVALAVRFEAASVHAVVRSIERMEDSHRIGSDLARELVRDGLRHVLIFSDGLRVNGSALSGGLRGCLPAGVRATGGLAGDGPNFSETTVVFGERAEPGLIVAVGLYGESLSVGCGSAGGWDPFGPRRLVTRARDNVLYELDGKPALALYKTYLGDRADGLPATGLLFPLELLPARKGEPSLVRTILAVDEAAQSLTFAGDVPEGRFVRLMKSTIDNLVWGAERAGEMTRAPEAPDFVLLVSCVGRRLLLGQRVEEEVEAVLTVLQHPAGVIGFYSYGEISPGGLTHGCELHNQTMTLTTLAERPV